MNTFATQQAARAFITANNVKYDAGRGRGNDGFHMIKGYKNLDTMVSYYKVELCPMDNVMHFAPASVKASGVTEKMSIADRAVWCRVKGMTREQAIAHLIEKGVAPQTAKFRTYHVYFGKVSKAHTAMIESGKWVGARARAA